MSKAVKNDYLHGDNQEEKTYSLPEDKEKTSVTPEVFHDVTRETDTTQARLRRAGLCCAPRCHVCDGDCSNCRYYARFKVVSIDSLVGTPYEPRSSDSVEDQALGKIMDENMRKAIPRLHIIDQIVLWCRAFGVPDIVSLEDTAKRIRKAIGRSYTPQAVRKRLKPAGERLFELIGYTR